ncbi:MAG: GNAT family N-acetyltransferase [Clostridiales bacterium]|nr:GNAT family N-acetyltransferase [Clostridiales bacterium]
MRIEKMKLEHRVKVGLLIIEKFKKSYDAFIMLPRKYTLESDVSDLVNEMIENEKAVVLIDDDIIGFIDISYEGEMFYNKQGVYTAEWGNCIPSNNLKGCLLLLNYIYDYMNDHKLLDHTISVMENEKGVIEKLFNMSYGSRCMDAHALIENKSFSNEMTIREATMDDMGELKTLLKILHKHMQMPPTLIGMSYSKEEPIIKKWLSDDASKLWVMCDANKVIGMMKTVNGASGGCDCSSDDETLGIQDTIILSDVQGQGLGKCFVDFVHDYGQKNGFKYLAVDFETMNPTAQYFWPKYFTPTVRSLIRSIG